jgi:hypothetical protein
MKLYTTIILLVASSIAFAADEVRKVGEADMLVVRCYNPSNKDWQVAMKISPWMLPDSINKPNRREQDSRGDGVKRPN